MIENRILLTTPTYPYPTLPANDSLTDATGQRFTKGDDIFTLISHTQPSGVNISEPFLSMMVVQAQALYFARNNLVSDLRRCVPA